jgi:hypothetical protein
MGAVNTTYTFTATDTITSTKMNNIIDETTMTSDAIIGTTLEVASGKLKIRSAGITSNEIGANSVTTTTIVDGAITPAKLSNSDFGDFTVASGVATLDSNVVTTDKILDANVTTSKILDANITAPKLNGAQTGTAPVYGARAWAKLNPYVGSVRTGAYKTGTYSRTATETSVAIVSHGLKVNDKIRLDFTTGTGTDGLYTVVSSSDANNFVVNHAGAATSGNVTAQFVAIQGNGNISSASWYDASDDRIVLNFAIPMPNANYVVSATGQFFSGGFYGLANEDTLGDTQLNTINQAHVAIADAQRFTNVVIFG